MATKKRPRISLDQISTIVDLVSGPLLSKRGQKVLCGTYSNGKPRSAIDALRDEYISPEDRERWDRMKAGKKKKNKKKKGKKGKKKNKDLFRTVRWS